MKNQKRASGISYSKIAKGIILIALLVGGYKLFVPKSAETSVDRDFEAPVVGIIGDESNATSAPEGELGTNGLSESKGTAEVHHETSTQDRVWSQQDFQKLTHKTLQDLPVLNDFKKLSQREAHHTPEIINRAGDSLGLVAEVLAAHPEFFPEAQDFYVKCFSRKDFPASVRALCLANHRNLRVSKGESPEWQQEEAQSTSEEVRDLAAQVPLS
ncbi:hypothetical protein BDW_09635 [Bdellovibrio bacteriovorus W]|nr:hypothetical protein BDW_09635 [Bdellovibrio bacteriovorus W]